MNKTKTVIPYPPNEKSKDHVVQDNHGRWYWYSEDYGALTGPYETKEEAQKAFSRDCMITFD
jgi:hypothetical protein